MKTRIALEKVQLTGGAVGGGRVLFRVAGQKGAALLTPLTFASGH